jgi:hypothetical protein
MTFVDYIMLAGLLCFCGFISYTAGQIADAIHSILHDWGYMSRYLPDGYVDYATYNIKEVLQFLQQLLGIISESWWIKWHIPKR